MTCPFCGSTQSFLTEVLALTQTGTQCPNCWSRLSSGGDTPLSKWQSRLDGRSSFRRELPGNNRVRSSDSDFVDVGGLPEMILQCAGPVPHGQKRVPGHTLRIPPSVYALSRCVSTSR